MEISDTEILQIKNFFNRFFPNGKETIEHSISFVVDCKPTKFYIKAEVLDEVNFIKLVPVFKIKLVSPAGQGPSFALFKNSKTTRTVLYGTSIFKSVLISNGLDRFEIGNIYSQYCTEYGDIPFSSKENLIDSIAKNFLTTPECKKEISMEVKKASEKLRSRTHSDLMRKFRIMLSLGENEEIVTDLFRQVQIENVLKS